MSVHPYCIRQEFILDPRGVGIPEEVCKECEQLWHDEDLPNAAIYRVDVEEDEYVLPKLVKFLKSLGIKECIINYWL